MVMKENIDFKGRLKRFATGLFFALLALYFWLTLEANSLKGFYRLVLVIPLFGAILSFLEVRFCYCVLKDRRSRESVKLYSIAIVVSIVVALFASII